MRYQMLFDQVLRCSDSSAVFSYLESTLQDSLRAWDYFVNWARVLDNYRGVEADLHTLNVLVGKPDVKLALRTLLRERPNLMRVIPILLACRDRTVQVLTASERGRLAYKSFSFTPSTKLSEEELDNAAEFAEKTGFLALVSDRSIRSLPDYVLGVEVGLDSNGRKNRGGTAMETIVGEMLRAMAQRLGYRFQAQARADQLNSMWRVSLRSDRTDRRHDFALERDGRLYLVEANFYGGGGSKLKATAGEYQSLAVLLREQGHTLVWITDGAGWRSTLRSLREAFEEVDYTLNLDMMGKGILDEILRLGL